MAVDNGTMNSMELSALRHTYMASCACGVLIMPCCVALLQVAKVLERLDTPPLLAGRARIRVQTVDEAQV